MPNVPEESRAARRWLALAVIVTLTVPTVFFLAGDAIDAPDAWTGRIIWSLAAGAAVLLVHAVAAAGRRSRILLALIVAALAAPFLVQHCADLAGEASKRAQPRMTDEQLRLAPSVLLITADRADPSARGFPAERWRVLDDVLAASPRRDPALASVLTGQPVIAHRVLRNGGAGPVPKTLSEMLAGAGLEVRVHGALPAWALGGQVAASGGLEEAANWIAGADGVARFAHVHLPRFDPDLIDAATRHLPMGSTAIVAASVVGAAPTTEGHFLAADALDVAVALRSVDGARNSLQVRPRSAREIHATISRWIDGGAGVLASSSAVGRPALEDSIAVDDVLVVAMAHGEGPGTPGIDGWPHRLHARFAGATLELEITPLGEHPTDDWELEGPTQEHVAYRNVVRVTPEARTPDIPELIARLARWREVHGALEWRREDPDSR